jgi:hypothetical protein
MKSIGISNMIDILSGKKYIYIPQKENEEYIKQLLIGHTISKVNENILELDNGIKLKFKGNDGCICGAGRYDITELNDCKNIITNVEFEDKIIDEDSYGDEHKYSIFVYAENKKIKLLQCDGDDGNGWYGTGYHIDIIGLGDDK